MFICRLFHRDNPTEQLDSRLLAGGAITIGRDPGADWIVDDEDGALSRIHCVLSVDGDRLLLTDRSRNGTYLGNGERAPGGEPVELELMEVIQLGALNIFIDSPPCDHGEDVAATRHVPLTQDAAPVPSEWADGAVESAAHRDASLLEAFCQGARLDASALSGEDPAELMRRVGAIYQQTILGMATLMSERTRLKGEYRLDRTTISAVNNNPFKWAPSRRLAQDLLSPGADGFLAGAEAVRASFEDLSQHMAATARGANAAVETVLETLSPSAIDAEAKQAGFSLKGPHVARWQIHVQRHAALSEATEGGLKLIDQAFRAAYAAPTSRR